MASPGNPLYGARDACARQQPQPLPDWPLDPWELHNRRGRLADQVVEEQVLQILLGADLDEGLGMSVDQDSRARIEKLVTYWAPAEALALIDEHPRTAGLSAQGKETLALAVCAEESGRTIVQALPLGATLGALGSRDPYFKLEEALSKSGNLKAVPAIVLSPVSALLQARLDQMVARGDHSRLR